MSALLVASLGSIWIDLGYGLAMAAGGAAAGILLTSRRRREAAANNEKLQLALVHLQDLTANVAQDVGQHNTRVQEISDELTTARAASGDRLEQLVVSSVSSLLKANEQLHEQLQTAENKLEEQAVALQTHVVAARTDAVTCTYNRRALDDELRRRMAEYQRRGSAFSVILLDIDYFKAFNDEHGHQAGDLVLRGVARVVSETMREMDFVARYGGEEFCILVPSTKLRDAVRAAERARAALEKAVFPVGSRELKVTGSLGVAEVGPADDPSSLVRRADEALYAAKKAGRNRIWLHDGQFITAAGVSTPPQARPDPKPADEPSQSERELAAFQEDLARRVVECQRFDVPLSLMMVGLDDVDRLELAIGTAGRGTLEAALADLLQSALQEIDLVCACGSGVFAVLLPGTRGESAVDLAERIRAAVSSIPLAYRGTALDVTASCGIAQARPGDGSENLWDRAASALAAARAAGRDTTHLDGAKLPCPLTS
jgi:diguanylate cyclase